eukprot:PhF_6_TR22397/c0_g1_i1/m.31802
MDAVDLFADVRQMGYVVTFTDMPRSSVEAVVTIPTKPTLPLSHTHTAEVMESKPKALKRNSSPPPPPPSTVPHEMEKKPNNKQEVVSTARASKGTLIAKPISSSTCAALPAAPVHPPPSPGGNNNNSTSNPSKRQKKIPKSKLPVPTALPPRGGDAVEGSEATLLNHKLRLLNLLSKGKPGVVELLHKYNEMKDVVTSLMGRMAVLQGVSVHEIFDRYGIDSTD